MSAVIAVKPNVKIADYLGIEAEKNVAEVTDEEIENEINMIRERNSREIEVTDAAAVMGDVCHINYEGFVDGVAFEGGKGEDYPLKLGSGNFIPGFEEEIVGHKVGEDFDVNVTFPTEYHASELAGKAATFKTKLNSLKFEELPELDDEFAKDVSEFDTLAEYKANLKATMEKRNDDRAESEVGNALALALAEKLEGEIPAPMFEAETENMVRDYDARLRQNGLDLGTYFKYTGLTLETLREQMRPQAEQQVKVRLALEKIASLENLTVTDEELETEYNNISTAYNVPLDEVKKMILAEDLKADVLVGHAMKLVRENAKIGKAKKASAKKATKTEAEAPAEEKKPARKPRAKKATTESAE
jgi:trigger factor